MKILVLADPYGRPSFAPRLRYICDYLTARGHEVEVFTEKWDTITFEHAYPIHEVPLHRKEGLVWFIQALWDLLTRSKDRRLARAVLSETRGRTFDIVFCTTFSTFPLIAARTIAQAKKLPLVVDIRDVDEQVPGHQYIYHRQWWLQPFRNLYTRVHVRRRNSVLRVADAVTTISPWHVDFLRAFNPRVHLVYNGFSPEQYTFEPIKADTFCITYIGRLYPFQQPEPVLQAIQELNLPHCEVHFYMNATSYDRLAPYGVHVHDYVQPENVPHLICQSAVLLVLTDPAAQGMMTTKFFEALGCEKPVLCYPSDEGLLAQTIRETNAGLATSDTEQIKTFLMDQYDKWRQNGFTHQAVQDKDTYSRLTQTRQLEHILHDIYRHSYL